MDNQTIKNAPDHHAFCIVGKDTLFLVHQIMTHMEAHSYELILEVSIPDDVKQKILEDRNINGNSHYLGNWFGSEEVDAFTIPSLASGNRKEFNANVWTSVENAEEVATELVPVKKDAPDNRLMGMKLPNATLPQPPWGGYWEKPEVTPWLTNVKVTVERVVHYRHINRNEISKRFEDYVLFGRGKEAHIMHSVLWQPEYDHVATLKEVPEWIDEEQLIATINICFPNLPFDNYSTYCNNPLKDKTRHQVLYFGLKEFRGMFGTFQNILPELYIEIEHTWWFSTRVINYWNYQFCTESKEIS
ncbi:MAG: hypothetical protein IPK35_07220 [Saprospiraceae bacterium]|nr:hypothetical protein [Saprospiraceae bacterium]